jgi:hypothetical protein
MKKSIFFKSLIVLFSIVSIVSCDIEPLDPAIDLTALTPNNPNGTALFSADFDGQTFLASSIQATLENGQLVIVGLRAPQGDYISILVDDASVGTFPANDNFISYQPQNDNFGFLGINFDNPTENTGSIIITSINTTNNTVSGTFSFKGYWTDTVNPLSPKTFTNGIFQNIPLTGAIGSPSTDTFYAIADGTEFVENQIDVSEVSSSGFPDAISIVASKVNGESISLSIDKNTPVGTYQMTGLLSTVDVVRGKYLVNGSLHGGVSGSLTITSITSTRIAGTFAFTAENISQTSTHQITQGAFDVELF